MHRIRSPFISPFDPTIVIVVPEDVLREANDAKQGADRGYVRESQPADQKVTRLDQINPKWGPEEVHADLAQIYSPEGQPANPDKQKAGIYNILGKAAENPALLQERFSWNETDNGLGAKVDTQRNLGYYILKHAVENIDTYGSDVIASLEKIHKDNPAQDGAGLKSFQINYAAMLMQGVGGEGFAKAHFPDAANSLLGRDSAQEPAFKTACADKLAKMIEDSRNPESPYYGLFETQDGPTPLGKALVALAKQDETIRAALQKKGYLRTVIVKDDKGSEVETLVLSIVNPQPVEEPQQPKSKRRRILRLFGPK